MVVEWYWRNKSGTYGPYTEEELIQLAEDGEITKTSDVRLGEDGRWYPAGKVKGLFTKPAARSSQGIEESTVVSKDDTQVVNGEGSSSTVLKLKRAKPLKPKVRPVSPAASSSSISSAAPPPPPQTTEQPARPPAAPPAGSGFVVQTEDGSAAGSQPVSQRPRRKSRGPLVFLILAGIFGCAAVGVSIAFVLTSTGDNDVATDTDAATPSTNETANESSNQVDGTDEADLVTGEALLAKVANFRDASTSRIKLGNAKVHVKQAQFVPVENGEGDEIHIHLEISNTSDQVTWSYSSFNGTGTQGKAAMAFLFDEAGRACDMVSLADRDTQWCPPTVPMSPGQTIEDVIVFVKPEGEFENLRLVLPRSGIDLTGTPMGYTLSAEMMSSPDVTSEDDVAQPANDQLAVQPDPQPNDTEASGDDTIDPAEMPVVADSAPTAAPSSEERANGTLPATVKGLLDSIDSFEGDDESKPEGEDKPAAGDD